MWIEGNIIINVTKKDEFAVKYNYEIDDFDTKE